MYGSVCVRWLCVRVDVTAFCPLLQRRKAAEDAIARGDIVTDDLPPGAMVPETKQGDLSMYSDVSAVGARECCQPATCR